MFKFVFVFLFISCKTCNGVEYTELRQFGENIRNLSLELFYYTEQETKSPVVMAPFTIWNLFSLFAFKTSSDSWRQLYSIIGIPRQDEQHFNSLFNYVTNVLKRERPGALFRSRYAVFYDTSLDLSWSFRKSIVNSGALLKKLDFNDNDSAAKLANEYIQVTDYAFLPKKIVFDKSDFEDSSMIVSGAVEFSGAWSLPFNESNTVLEDGDRSSVYMMHQWASVRFAYIELLGASVLELPYGEDQDYCMLIIRPQKNVSITDVLRNFSKIKFVDVILQLYSVGLKKIHVKLPKVSLKSVLILNNPLMSMDARDIFSSDLANFSGLTKSDVYVSEMQHRAEIMIGEAGTVATAYTPANLANPTRDDKYGTASPFLFFIVHQPSMSIIFSGKYGEYN